MAGSSVAQTPKDPPRIGPRLEAARTRVVPGDVTRVPVLLAAAPDVESVQLEFVYDATNLKLITIERGKMLGELATLEADLISSPGRALVRINSASQPLTGDGELFKARFEIDDGAPQAGHKLLLENIKAYRVARSQGDGPSDLTEVPLAAYAGELRVIDGPVPIWFLAALAILVLVVLAISREPDGVREPVAIRA